MNLKQAKTMEEARKVVRTILFDNLEGLEKIIAISQLIKNAIPKDATEDFYVGAQYSLFIVVEMLQQGLLRGIATENTFADIGLAFLYFKQNEEMVFIDLKVFDDWLIEDTSDPEYTRQILKDALQRYKDEKEIK